jgi:hypothetical protein
LDADSLGQNNSVAADVRRLKHPATPHTKSGSVFFQTGSQSITGGSPFSWPAALFLAPAG